MEELSIPVVYPIQEGNYVTVPSESWNSLCATVNKIIEIVNLHSSKLESTDKTVHQTIEDISKIGKILEGFYETLN